MARYLRHCPRRDTLTSSRAIKSVRLTFVPPRCAADGTERGRKAWRRRPQEVFRHDCPGGKILSAIYELDARPVDWPGRSEKESFGRLPFRERAEHVAPFEDRELLSSRASKIRIRESDMIKAAHRVVKQRQL